MKKMASLNKEASDKVVAVLTPDQKISWKEMTGDPFELKMDPNAFGGRGK